jgi:hypothetical protein
VADGAAVGTAGGGAMILQRSWVANMVRSDGTRVSLSTGDWLKIAISNAIAVGVTIITLWTKQAVIEVEIVHLKQAIAKLEHKLESR